VIVFETERLLVRHLQDDDFEAFHALCSDLEIARYMDNGEPLTAEQTRTWIKISQENYQKRGYGCFAITSRLDAQLLGFGGIGRPAQPEITYAFKQSCWGQGLASEFVRSLLATCFERWQLPRIEASIDSRNYASIRVVEKAGMAFVRSEMDENNQRILWYALDRPASPHL
jgi:[ribosomal protein S5]-alanine N-acetyltransferase